MNRFATSIAVATTLLLTQNCSLLPRTREQLTATNQNQSESIGSNEHSGHSMSNVEHREKEAIAQAKLTAPKNITPNTPVPLAIDIQNQSGKAITSFDRFQDKLMHLIIVDDNFQYFSHIHPEYKGNGRFEVKAILPRSSNYTLFSDYKPTGQKEQVSVLKTQLPGNSPSIPRIDLNRTKTFANTKVNLSFSEPTLKAGQEVTLIFNLQQTANNQPIADLKPYLGEQGHLVILKQSSPLTASNYIHAHAIKKDQIGKVHFMTMFPQPGKYKLWGQFNRDGKIITANFWVNVI